MAYVPIYDGTFSSAQEVEGSPSVGTDEITRALLITRTYAVGLTNYTPQAQGTADPGYANTYLINETPASIQGPIKFFNRNYAQVPSSRTENRMIAFTIPGKSEVVTSDISTLPIGWNAYGSSAPYTKQVLADVNYSYAYVSPGSDPSTGFSVPTVTALTYNSRPVDYTGDVYVSIGQATVVVGGGQPDIIEERFQYAGTVTGFTSGNNWTVSVDIRRWKGAIWEMEVVVVPSLILT